jgi:DNA adenine methylase
MSNLNVRPVLKWVGGKRELIPQIREYYKNLNFKNYIEPFFGGGSVYLDIISTFGEKYISNSIINDVNTDLIELYRNIKTDPNEIISTCIELEKTYYEKGYYHIRERFNGVDKEKNIIQKYQGIERSSSLILLNRTCFNGLYRVNGKGLFNVPEGSYKNPKIVDSDNLFKLSNVLPEIHNIRNVQFDEISDIKKDDLVYFDPPYHPLNETSSFTSYSGSFGENEQIKLRDYFKKLDELGVFVILSNSSSPFIKELYKDFNIIEVDCRRNINSKSDKRGKVTEYLILGNTLLNS